MANKKFHLTPDGPKKCTAVFKSCRYGNHYTSEESAIAAHEITRKKSEHKRNITGLKNNLNNFNPDFFMRSAFDFKPESKSARLFAEELTLRENQYKTKLQLFHSIRNFRLDNGSYKPVKVQVMRMAEVDEENARYAGVWRIITQTTRSSAFSYQKIDQEIHLDFRSETKSKKSMLQANEVFRNAAIMSGIRDDDEADAKAQEMVDSFKVMFNSIETESEGPTELWEKGQGYFKESDSETIRVNETFNNSSFRPETFKTFLETNTYYESYTPEAELRITDENTRNGTSWALYKKDGQWSVAVKQSDGTTKDPICTTEEEVRSHVFYAVYRGVNENDEKEAHRKANFAVKLFNVVEQSLEDNRAKVEKNWADEKSSIEDRKTRARKIVETEGHASDKNTIKKIFDAFSS